MVNPIGGKTIGKNSSFFHVDRGAPPRAKRRFENSEKRTEQMPPPQLNRSRVPALVTTTCGNSVPNNMWQFRSRVAT